MKGNFIRAHSHIQSHSLLSLGSLAAFFLAGKGRTSPTGAVVKADSEPIALVAAPGRVEPVSEEIKISSELRGKLKLDAGQYLPAGLRVDSFSITGKSLPVAR